MKAVVCQTAFNQTVEDKRTSHFNNNRIYFFRLRHTYAFFKKYYLAALGLTCGMLDLSLWCVAFSCYGTRALEHMGLLVAVRRLSCSKACGILVPQPEIEPVSPALKGRFLTAGPPGKSPHTSTYIFYVTLTWGSVWHSSLCFPLPHCIIYTYIPLNPLTVSSLNLTFESFIPRCEKKC